MSCPREKRRVYDVTQPGEVAALENECGNVWGDGWIGYGPLASRRKRPDWLTRRGQFMLPSPLFDWLDENTQSTWIITRKRSALTLHFKSADDAMLFTMWHQNDA